MVDHRCTLGESGRGYPCHILKPSKIALVVVSGTQSPAAIDVFLSVFFQVHRSQKSPWPARCMLSALITESLSPQLNFVLQVWCMLTQIRPIFSVQLIINA